MAKDHSDSTDNLNDDSIEAQPGPATDNFIESPSVQSAVQNPDQAPRQQKRAAKRAALKPKIVSNAQPANVSAQVYRLRTKIEGFFSILKRISGDHCWSRGRPRQTKNAEEPCIAWKNETLCKFIFMNLRTTVSLQEETGYTIDYATDRFFPAPIEPLIAAA